MSRQQYIDVLKREVEKLNKQIDIKILQGLNYSSEARKHKLLLSEIRKHSVKNFWKKFLPVFGF
jgi:hypothetical protein